MHTLGCESSEKFESILVLRDMGLSNLGCQATDYKINVATYTLKYAHTCTDTCTRTHILTHAHTQAHTHTCMAYKINVHMHSHTHACMHTHIHTHTCTDPNPLLPIYCRCYGCNSASSSWHSLQIEHASLYINYGEVSICILF